MQPEGVPATGETKRRLEAVPAPRSVDRSQDEWLATYPYLSDDPVPDERYLQDPKVRRPYRGAGLKVGPMLLFSAIVEAIGERVDGRRLDRPAVSKLNGAYLCKKLRCSYDNLATWTRHLERPIPCPDCARGHALISVDRSAGRGGAHWYRLVRCMTVPDAECVSFESAIPKPRVRSGAKPGAQDPLARTKREAARAAEIAAAGPGLFDALTPAGVPALALDDVRTKIVRCAVDIEGFEEQIGDETCALIAAQAVAAGALTSLHSYQDAVIRVVVGARFLCGGRPVESLSADEVARLLAAGGPLRDAPMGPEAAEVDSGKVSGFADPLSPVERAKDVFATATDPTMRARSVPRDEVEEARRWSRDALVKLSRRWRPTADEKQGLAAHRKIEEAARARGIHDALAIEREIQRIVTDPRVCGAGVMKPLARVNAGLRDGWIWEPYDSQDRSGQMAGAFAKLHPGLQAEAVRIVRGAIEDGRNPIVTPALQAAGVSTKAMLDYVVERTRAMIEAESA